MSAPRQTLAQQLKELHNAAPTVEADPETAYSSLTALKGLGDNAEGREHYVEFGKSRLRDAAAQTFSELDAKYGVNGSGPSKPKRVKIFDDDESDAEEDDNAAGASGSEMDDDDDSEDMDDDDEEDEDDMEDEEDGHEGEEDEEMTGDEEEADEESDEPDEPAAPAPKQSKAGPVGTLDPLAAIKASKAKDIEKGQAIKRQQALYDDALAVRLSFQKVFSTAFKVVSARKRMQEASRDSTGSEDGQEVLTKLASLNERLFDLRQEITLPGVERQRKRKRASDEASEAKSPEYWLRSAEDSFALADEQHPQAVSILNKWSAKIQAATMLQAGGKASTKFSSNDQLGVVEVIDNALNAKARSNDNRKLEELEEGFYRGLLREIIDARAGSGSGPSQDLLNMRKEKKKKREAERGGSKGRRLRYTVHEKIQNFTVPVPLEQAWHDEQIDELFSSLLGGAGMEGAGGESGPGPEAADRNGQPKLSGLEVADGSLAGLRVF